MNWQIILQIIGGICIGISVIIGIIKSNQIAAQNEEITEKIIEEIRANNGNEEDLEKIIFRQVSQYKSLIPKDENYIKDIISSSSQETKILEDLEKISINTVNDLRRKWEPFYFFIEEFLIEKCEELNNNGINVELSKSSQKLSLFRISDIRPIRNLGYKQSLLFNFGKSSIMLRYTQGIIVRGKCTYSANITIHIGSSNGETKIFEFYTRNVDFIIDDQFIKKTHKEIRDAIAQAIKQAITTNNRAK